MKERQQERERMFFCVCVCGPCTHWEEIDSWKQSEELVILNTTRHHTHTHTRSGTSVTNQVSILSSRNSEARFFKDMETCTCAFFV